MSFRCFPAKTNLQDHARILQESCMQDLLGTCTRYVPFLAQSCTILHQFLQDLAKKVQETPNLQVIILAASLAKSCTISCTNRTRMCKNRARLCKKRDIKCARAKQVLHARFLQDSCMILQVRFCWVVNFRTTEQRLLLCPNFLVQGRLMEIPVAAIAESVCIGSLSGRWVGQLTHPQCPTSNEVKMRKA